MHPGGIYFNSQYTVSTVEGHDVTSFLSAKLFFKMPGQKTTKKYKNTFDNRKVMIMTSQEEEILAAAIGDHLDCQSQPGHQVLSNEGLAAFRAFVPRRIAGGAKSGGDMTRN